jgi:hypothetical protein
MTYEILNMMILPKSFTTITPFSKTLAAILFITFPFVGFLAGMEYQKNIYTQIPNQTAPSPTPGYACDLDAKTCPDGSTVGRIGPSCEFAKCPSVTNTKKVFCGGPEKISCPPGYVCKSDKDYPDPEGECVPSSDEIPPKSWDDSVCTQEAKLCPDGSYVSRQGPNCEFAPCPGTR